jgi:hypothetical protein
MKRLIAVLPRSKDAPVTLSLNILGALNRNQTRDKTLSDGTPPTPGVVDQFWRELGVDTTSVGFDKVTYGPAAGFPTTLELLTKILGLDPTKRVLLNDGGGLATCVRERAFLVHTNSTPVLWRFDSIVDFQQVVSSDIDIYLQKGGNIQICLDDKLPQFPRSDHAPLSLSLELVGNPKIYEQMLFQQGYIGPILEPVSQFLLPQFIETPIQSVTMTIPSLHALEQGFTDYFSEQTGHAFDSGALVSGGCSGALYDILRYSPHSEAVILAPFFSPQEGIVLSANRRLSIAPSPEAFIATLSESKALDVLMTFPNNPDGNIPTLAEIRHIIDIANQQGHRLIIDMTYFNFVTDTCRAQYESVVGEIKDTAMQYLMIASGSKALGLTKYRVALVVGDSVNLTSVREHNLKANTAAALALSLALQSDTRDAFRNKLRQHVADNTRYIQEILDDQLSCPVETLNSGLQKLHTLARRFPKNTFSFKPGEGALYGLLCVASEEKAGVMREAADLDLALTPGVVFSGGHMDIEEVLQTPQSMYRLSLMAKAADS